MQLKKDYGDRIGQLTGNDSAESNGKNPIRRLAKKGKQVHDSCPKLNEQKKK